MKKAVLILALTSAGVPATAQSKTQCLRDLDAKCSRECQTEDTAVFMACKDKCMDAGKACGQSGPTSKRQDINTIASSMMPLAGLAFAFGGQAGVGQGTPLAGLMAAGLPSMAGTGTAAPIAAPEEAPKENTGHGMKLEWHDLTPSVSAEGAGYDYSAPGGRALKNGHIRLQEEAQADMDECAKEHSEKTCDITHMDYHSCIKQIPEKCTAVFNEKYGAN